MSEALRKAALQALEALDVLVKKIERDAPDLSGKSIGFARQASDQLRAALAEPEQKPNRSELYWRLHALSKCLEGSGRIDEHDTPDAYSTVIDAMKASLAETEQSEPVAWRIRCTDPLRDWVLAYKYPTDGPFSNFETQPLYTHPPRREPLTPWIKTSEQYPPEGVRVFWFEPRTNQVGYDTWMGGDYRFNAEYWMHIPGLVDVPTRKPLTPEAIWDNDEIMSKSQGKLLILDLVDLVRAVEAAHGITGGKE